MSHMLKGWENWDCSSWRSEVSEDLINVYKILQGFCEDNRVRLFSVLSNEREESQIETEVVPSDHENWKILRVTEQVAQRACGISLKILQSRFDGWPPLDVSAWAERLNRMPSWSVFQTQPFFNSMKKRYYSSTAYLLAKKGWDPALLWC